MSKLHTTLFVGIGSIILAGCQFTNPFVKKVVAPSPAATPFVRDLATPAPVATDSAVATVSAAPRKGTVLGATTTQTQKKTEDTTYLYDVSFDKLEVTNFPGQTQNATLTLTNKSSEAVLWYIKLNQAQSPKYPINVNGTNEVTGTIAANGTSTVSVGTMSTDQTPLFSGSFEVVFNSRDNVVAKRMVNVIIHSTVSEMVHVNSTDDANSTISFVPNGSFRVWIENKHGKNLNWSASIEQGGDKLRLVAPSGYFLENAGAFFPVYFTSADRGGLNTAKIVITYSDDNHVELNKHILTLNFQ